MALFYLDHGMGGASIRWNPYIYAGANPVNYVDPDGRCFLGIDTAICLAIAAGALVGHLDFDNNEKPEMWIYFRLSS